MISSQKNGRKERKGLCVSERQRFVDSSGVQRQSSKREAHAEGQSQSSLKNEEAEWLTSKQAAQYLQISEGTLRNMASNGRIPYFKLGRSNRYNRQELLQLLLSKRKGAIYGD